VETLKSLPGWFWISLIVIAVVTIGATRYCNNKRKENADEVADKLTPANTQDTIFDSISTINNVFS
jgi:hypothetical protein